MFCVYKSWFLCKPRFRSRFKPKHECVSQGLEKAMYRKVTRVKRCSARKLVDGQATYIKYWTKETTEQTDGKQRKKAENTGNSNMLRGGRKRWGGSS